MLKWYVSPWYKSSIKISFLYAGICIYNGTNRSVNSGKAGNTMLCQWSFVSCLWASENGKEGRCHPEDSYVPTSRLFNIGCDVICGMHRRSITLFLNQLPIQVFFFSPFCGTVLRKHTQIGMPLTVCGISRLT